MIDLSAARFVSPGGHLALYAKTGIIGTIDTEVDVLTVVNESAGGNADIIVREVDSLQVAQNYNPLGGLYAANGTIDVVLAAKDALFTHRSGVIQATPGAPISILADDIDLRAGQDSVIGSGELTLRAISNDSLYKIGGAGQSASGADLSINGPDGSFDLSMRDIDSLAGGFSHIYIGHNTDDTFMTIGDLKDLTINGYLQLITDADGARI